MTIVLNFKRVWNTFESFAKLFKHLNNFEILNEMMEGWKEERERYVGTHESTDDENDPTNGLTMMINDIDTMINHNVLL